MTQALVRRDAEIQLAVLNELRWDTHVEETDVGVEVDSGIVTLTGTVDSYAKRIAAQQAAHRVTGVLDVANNIRIRTQGPSFPADTEIAQAVRLALKWDAHVPHELIQSTVSNGWVTMEGEVDYWRQRVDAERVVHRLAGVLGVLNQITVKASLVDSHRLRDAIEEALERTAEREARDIQITVHEGTVRLSGSVHSWREKRAVVGAVGHAPGVRSIEDDLRINPYP